MPLDRVPAGVVVVTDRGEVVQVNRLLLRSMGRADEAGRLVSVDQLFNPASRLLFHSYLMPLLQLHGEVAGLSLALRQRDGQDLDLLVRASRSPSPDHPEHEALVHLALFPWKESRRLEQQLLSAKRAAEQVPGLIFELRRDSAGRYSFPYVSDAGRHLDGITPHQALGDAMLLFQTVAPEHRLRMRDAFEASARDLTPVRLE